MSDVDAFFELGGVVVPIEANNDVFSQSCEPLQAETWPPLRFRSGRAAKLTTWSGKLRVVMHGEGNAGAALAGIDFKNALLLKCGKPYGIAGVGTSNVFTLTTKRRTDVGFEPYGYAVVAGRRVLLATTLVGNVATVATVAAASSYGVYYFPEITVWARWTENSAILTASEYSWTVEAEEQ